MQFTLLKGKIHRATVTQCDLHYEGSISVDSALMERAGILPHEQVDVLNINNGNRFTTYAIPAPAGSGVIGINGAAAARDRASGRDGARLVVRFLGARDGERRGHGRRAAHRRA